MSNGFVVFIVLSSKKSAVKARQYVNFMSNLIQHKF